LKSLRFEISFNTITSIAVVSTLIISLSIYVYEKLYIEFIASEVEAIAQNMAIDLLDYIDDPAGQFHQTQILLRLEEYEYVETANLYDDENNLINSYVGKAGLSLSKNTQDKDVTQSLKDYKHQPFNGIYSELPLGMHNVESKVVVVKNIGEISLPLGKLILTFNLQDALQESRQRYVFLVAPSVIALTLLSLFISTRLQRRSLRPLENLIKTMDSVVDEQSYDVTVDETNKLETAALSRAFNNMMANIKSQSELNAQKNLLLEQQQSKLETLANFDVLTGLPNRQYLLKILSTLLAKNQRENNELCLMFLDVDGFKSINDSFGHDTGDKLLLHISAIMSSVLPDNATLGRLGGDEFLVIIDNVSTHGDVEHIATNLIESVMKAHDVNRLRLDSSLSIGIAVASECSYEVSNLITNADVAMYRAKKEGKGRFVWFNSAMFEDTQRKMQISMRLSNALDNDNFYLTYQTKVGPNKNVEGVEVLLRWHDAVLGHVSPAEFIPIAEKADKISHISLWVINQTCKELPQLIARFGSHIRVSINLSPHDLNNTEVTNCILDGLDSGEISAQHIEFEITETAYMNNFGVANSFFEALKKHGCHLSLDDFGTGYSSLSYLTEFNIDTLKIDRQFVSQIGQSERSEKITVAIITMAKSLNFAVCAEGVETEEQEAFLLAHDCDLLQGFLYSRPSTLCQLQQQVKTK
jgi:diguanylate cyclase (GGDEF)-like protein